MVNKLFLVTMLLSGGFIGSVHAQDSNQASKKEVVEIKKDSMYLYGEGVAETDSVCERLAEQRFTENLSQYIKSNPSLASATVVTMPPIKKIMKRITFDRSVKRKVVFLYVKKSEIIPVLMSKQADKPIAISEKPVEQLVQEPTPKEENVGDNQQTQAYVPNGLNYNGLTIKDADILQEIVNLETFDKIREYVVNRKSTKHDIFYRATNEFNDITDSGYWIVFNKERKLMAIVGKDKHTILYNKQTVALDALMTKAKIWLSIK